MRVYSRFCWLIVSQLFLFMLVGCGPKTTDPRAGGLFSYDPDAYKERLATREAALQDENNNAAQLSAEKNQLNQIKEEKRLRLEKLQVEFDAFRKSLFVLEEKLKKTTQANEAEKEKFAQLKKQLGEIHNKSFEVSSTNEDKEKLLSDLEKRKKELEEEIDLLMKI